MSNATDTAARYHVIAGRDELVSGTNDPALAETIALRISASRKCAIMVSDTQSSAYTRFWNGRKLAR